jgi:hypothetical protein
MLGHVTRSRSIALVLVLVVVVLLIVLAYAGGFGRNLPARVDPPPSGAQAEIGVPYGVSVDCPIPIELGGLWWAFPAYNPHWPPDITIPPWPFSIWANLGDPYPVPGILTLSSATEAVFRADSDGSEFAMTAHRQNPMDGAACL